MKSIQNLSLALFLGFVSSSLNAEEVGLEEYCFEIDRDVSIGARNVTTTPEEFINQNPNVFVAINGVYFGQDQRPEGLVFLSDNHHLATERPQHTRGYFTVNKRGDKVKVTEKLEDPLKDYWLVIGTHPLLVEDGHLHSQSQEARYSNSAAQRSAIGTKNGKNICFAVSKGDIAISNWAKKLESKGYLGAINLDGGPYSQLAVRTVGVYPKNDRLQTKQVLFGYRRGK